MKVWWSSEQLKLASVVDLSENFQYETISKLKTARLLKQWVESMDYLKSKRT